MSRNQPGSTAARFPRWIVTAPHRLPHSLAGRHPWGVHHARRGDTQTTACGKPILTWLVFWHLGFETAHPQACADCAREISQATAPTNPGRSAATF